MEDTIENITEIATNTIQEQTNTFFVWLQSFLTWENLFKFIGAIVVLFFLFILYKFLLHAMNKLPSLKNNVQRGTIIQKFLKYCFYIIVSMYVLSLFGVKLSALLGAAGVVGVALGFAAQTSVSNLISGIFVLTEGSLKIGDAITINGITGIVDSVNLLSVTVHTYDNQMVRIPNSSIINNNLINNSYHNQRRLTLTVSVSYDTPMDKIIDVLLQAPSLCPSVLTTPEPAAWFECFNNSGIDITVAVWFEPKNFIKAKNEIFCAIKKVLDDAKVEIPFNKLDVKILEK
ncbi:MAG: mechanosensitive ion channel family protein [Treponema sp.]|jgi:small-conductance mechanosensitive channel|nr:mechanosensitive ion channel family protein [Treponema sp.]